MKYYLYNQNRYFTGSQDYPTGIRPANGTTTPPNNEPNQKWMGNEWKNVPQRQKTLDELKLDKTQEAVEFYEAAVKSTLVGLADFEPASWETQRNEWERYSLDSQASVPYCTTLAATRGIALSDLMTKIQTKILAGATAQGALHGKLDLIEAATTIEELNAVVFE